MDNENNIEMTKVEQEYGANEIQVLEGLEAVRKRPGMYIGSTGPRGLHHLVYEIVDNSIDEALAGYCTKIDVVIEEGNIIRVTDNGRGIPVGINSKTGLPAVTVVFTVLHGRLRRLGQETGPEKLHTRSIISSTSMKRYAFILLVLLSAGAVRAQRYEKNILGVRAGVNVSTCAISIEDVRINTGSRAGFHFAVTDQILLHRSLPLYLETGIGFSSRGGRAAAEIYGDIYNMTMRPFYMQAPLLVNYHFHIRDLLTIQPFAGIYGGVGIRGAMKTEYGNEDMFSAPGFLSRMDFGVRAGAGFVIRRIYLGISYDIGCRDLFRGGEFFGYALQPESAEIRNNCLTVNIGYNF